MPSENITNLNVGGRQFNVDDLLKSTDNSNNAQDTAQEDKPVEEITERPVILTHRDEWMQDLTMNRVNKQDAERILDTIMQKGFYEESYRIAGKIFKLRTRTTVDSDRLIEMLRSLSPETEAEASHLIARVNVAASLSKFGDNTFPHSRPTDENRALLDEEWRLRWSYISSLPQPIFLAIAQTMQRFDLKVKLACDARAMENF